MPTGRSVFTKFRVFPIYNIAQVYYIYNIAQENTKLFQWMSKGKFSMFTSSYVNTAINQSAFRILKCYIINIYMIDKRGKVYIKIGKYIIRIK